MTEPIDVARSYLRAIESGDERALDALIDPAMVYRELPNRFMPSGSVNDKKTMLARFVKGKAFTTEQRYEIRSAVVQSDAVRDGRLVSQRNYDCFEPF